MQHKQRMNMMVFTNLAYLNIKTFNLHGTLSISINEFT